MNLTEVGNFLYDNYGNVELTLEQALAIGEYVVSESRNDYMEFVQKYHPYVKYSIQLISSRVKNYNYTIGYFYSINVSDDLGESNYYITEITRGYIIRNIKDLPLPSPCYKFKIFINVSIMRTSIKEIIEYCMEIPYSICHIELWVPSTQMLPEDNELIYDNFVFICKFKDYITRLFINDHFVMKDFIDHLANSLEIKRLTILADLLRTKSTEMYNNTGLIEYINNILTPPAKAV